ncbi:MAG: hypothetical protein ACRD47_00315, partial [Nitrososphaeraceae archaeon]
ICCFRDRRKQVANEIRELRTLSKQNLRGSVRYGLQSSETHVFISLGGVCYDVRMGTSSKNLSVL